MPKVNNKKPSKRRSNQQQQQQQETIQHPCLVFKNKREKVKYLLNELALLYHKNSDIVIDECEIHFIEVIKELKTHLDIYSLLQQKIDAWQKDVDFIHQKNKKARMCTHFSANALLKDKIEVEKLLSLLDKAFEKRRDVTGFLIKDLDALRVEIQVQCKFWKMKDGLFELMLIPKSSDRKHGQNYLWMKKKENTIRQWIYQKQHGNRTIPLEPEQVYRYLKNQYKDIIKHLYKNINDKLRSYEQLKTFTKCYYDTEVWDLLFNQNFLDEHLN